MANFYAGNAAIRFPLDDRAPVLPMTRRSDGTTFPLPTQTIVDCGFLAGQPLAFDPAIHDAYLAAISRAGDTFTFALATTAAGVAGATLRHARLLADADWTTSWADATAPDGTPLAAGSCGDAFVLRGYLVTGPLGALSGLIDDGDALIGGPALAFDATLVQTYKAAWVTGISVGNEGRMHAIPPGTAAPPFDPPDHIQRRCLAGTVRLRAGYNCLVDEDPAAARLTVTASVGSGAGEPCGEVPAYPGESPPDGGPFLSGGAACADLILAVNGLSAAGIAIVGGAGVTVSPGTTPHALVVDLTGDP